MSGNTPCSIDQRPEALVIEILCPRLDEQHTRVIHDQIVARAAEAGRLPVIVDLSRVELVPSVSLGALVALLQHFKQHNRRFILSGLRPALREGLTITRLDKLFEIRDGIDDAIASVTAPL